MKNNILLIGVTGFIGRNLLETFLCSSNNLTLLLRKKMLNESYSKYQLVRIIEGCLEDTSLLEQIIKENNINIVIHLASNLIPSSNENDFYKEMDIIVSPTFKLIDYCSKYDIKFIFFSSGGTIYGKTDSMIISEEHSRKPINYYGFSKLLIEDYILFKHRTNQLEYLILRPSNVYGKYQRVDKNQGFIAVAINNIIKKKTIEIWGDGETVRDYINAQDLAKVTKLLIDNTITNKIINLGSGKGTSLNEIIDILSKKFHTNMKVIYKDKRKVDLNKMILNTALLNSLIDINFIPLDKGILDYIETIGIENDK